MYRSNSGARTGEAELLFTVLRGISARKVAVDETVNTSLLLARQAVGHSTNGVQQLARESMELGETVMNLQNQLNSKNAELIEVKESLKVMNEDKEDLHEAIEQLQQLLQCSDDELEALKEENEDLHQQIYMHKNRITDPDASSSHEIQCKSSGDSNKYREFSQKITSALDAASSTQEQIKQGAGLFSQSFHNGECDQDAQVSRISLVGTEVEPDHPVLCVPLAACAASGSSLVLPQDVRTDVGIGHINKCKESTEELDDKPNKVNCTEAVRVCINVQPSICELEELQGQLEMVETEREQLSEALQLASIRYLKEIEQLQIEKGEWSGNRDQLEILEAENGQLRLVVAELDKAHRKITKMHVELEEQAELNQSVLANHAVLVQRLDSLSERLKSRDAHMGETLDAAKEVGRENLKLQEQILELKMRVLSEQADKDRLEGELRQLLNRISERQSRSTSIQHPGVSNNTSFQEGIL